MRSVLLDEIFPIGRDIGVDENSAHWALWFAQTAVDALVWVDIHHVIAFVDAVHRAHRHARLIFDANTGFSYNVGHAYIVLIAKPPRQCNRENERVIGLKKNKKRSTG